MLTTFSFESNTTIYTKNWTNTALKKRECIALIKDFFRTEIQGSILSAAQLQLLLQAHDHELENLEEALWKQLEGCHQVKAPSFFEDELNSFCNMMKQLKETYGFIDSKLKEDFEDQKNFYKPLKNKKLDSIYSFIDFFKKDSWTAEDFDLLICHGLLICDFLSPENKYKKKKQEEPLSATSLNYPYLISILQTTLYPLVKKAQSYEFIFARLLYVCYQLKQKYVEVEEKDEENDLLKKMVHALNNPSFLEKVSGLYQAAIIDEFQDTDPVQWEIFHQLFLKNSHCKVYLVGDPKQSIYAFRNADIYTYLNAAQFLGTDNHVCLDTNYRSHSSLIHGLNTLFSNCPYLFSLPQILKKPFLDYTLVNPSSLIEEKFFSDAYENIHFFGMSPSWSKKQKMSLEQAEEEFFFPFIAQEILKLCQTTATDSVEKNVFKFKDFAVLIKDRFQAERLAHFLKRYCIPYQLQKQTSLVESIIWESMKELLRAVIYPKNETYLKIALGGL